MGLGGGKADLQVGCDLGVGQAELDQTITTAGRVFILPDTPACQSGTQQACDAWIASQHVRRVITYQPASRYRAFQWHETALFLALTTALAGCCLWRIRHGRLP